MKAAISRYCLFNNSKEMFIEIEISDMFIILINYKIFKIVFFFEFFFFKLYKFVVILRFKTLKIIVIIV